MRVTENRLIDLASAATSARQSDIAQASAEVSSGMRVTKPSEDPMAWLAAQRAHLRRALAEGANGAVQTSRDRILEAESALATIGDAVSQVRALAIQGGSASVDPTARAQLAVNVRALFQNVLAAANTRSADGEYLFGGSQSLTVPFDAAGVYQGDALVRSVPTLENGTAVAALSGAELTAANGVDVLPLIEQIAAALDANDLTALQTGIGNLDTAIKQVSLTRTRSGAITNVLDATAAAHGELTENLDQEIARHVETDSIEAATRLAKASQAFEASRAVSAHIVALIGQRSS